LTEVFALLDLRLALMPAVADYKRRFSLPVEDLTQEASVLEAISTLAQERGQNSEALQELFRVQIDLAKEVQQFVLDNPERLPVWARGLHLNTDLRPVLSGLNRQIINAVAGIPSLSLSQDELVRRTEGEIVTEGVTAAGKQRLGKTVWRTITDKSPRFSKN
jgi:chorismate mutase